VRSHRPALLIAIALLAAAPAAQAKVRNIPATLGDNLAKLTAAPPLALLHPDTLPFRYGG
jgi:hypothetical protein